MKHTPASLVVLILVLCVGPASAQEHALTPDQLAFAQGTHVTRRLLHELHFTPLQQLEDYDKDPANTLLVVLGDLSSVLAQLDCDPSGKPGRLNQFLISGGAVLIASDVPADPGVVNQILGQLGGVLVNLGTTRITTSNPAQAYKEFPDCPYVVPIPGRTADQLFGTGDRQLTHLATNQPSALWRNQTWPRSRDITDLASYPTDYQVETRGAPLGMYPPLFAVGGPRGAGKVLLLADHSVLVNMMMLPRDNDNVPFALNAFTWLRESSRGQRSKALFVVDGFVNSLFEVPLKMPQHPELPEIKPEDLPFLVAQADGILAGLEDDNKFDPALQRLESQGRRGSGFWTIVAALGSLVLLIWGSWRVMFSGRSNVESGLPTLGRAVDLHTPEVSTLALRQRALLRGGNFWEPARALAREAFGRAGVVVPAGSRLPRIVARGGFWERWRRSGWVRNLWLLAFGPPRRVTAAEWARLPEELNRLVDLLQSGDIALLG